MVVVVVGSVADTDVGTLGAVQVGLGVTELEAALAALVPPALVAVTVNVYAVPLVKPVTVIGLVVVAVLVPPAGFEIAV